MKTIIQALIDEVHWPIPCGFVENVCIKRYLDKNEEITPEIITSHAYKGALADCLYSLVQAINYSEADKTIGNLSDQQRKLLLRRANSLYDEIGEEEVDDGEPRVYFGG